MVQKKKSIVFTSGMFPPALGGPGTVLVALLPKLVSLGYSCKVLTYGNDDGKNYGFPVIRASLSIFQPFRFFLLFWQIFRESLKADVIYALDTYSHGLCSLIVSKMLFKPLIVRFTGDSAWEILFNEGKIKDYIVPFQKKWYGFWPALLKLRRTIILAGADKIITDAEFLKKLVGIIGVSTEKVVVINNPVKTLPELNDFNPNGWKERFNIHGPVIFSMSRLVPWKGVEALIRLVPALNKKFPGLTLLVAGDGPQGVELRKLSKDLGLDKLVIFLGTIDSEEEKKKLYEVSDIFIQNTFYEGMSNGLIEAMSAGKPIITTDAGGNPEFVNNENGIVVSYNNAEEIEKAVMTLLSDRDLMVRLGRNSKLKAETYTLDKLVQRNVALIDSLA